MTKNRIFSFFCTTLVLSSVCQITAFAKSPVSPGPQAVANTTDSASPAPESVASSTAPAAANTNKVGGPAKHSSLAKKFLGVMTGVIVGTPVCMVRKPMDEDKYAVADLTGNSTKAKAVVPTAIFWAPFSAVGGILEAPFCAVNNSLVNYDKPFSKEQFSLVKPGAAIKKEEQQPDPRPGDVR
jgi:hypothetical protein